MSTKHDTRPFLNRYYKRRGLLGDFTTLGGKSEKAGFDQRITGLRGGLTIEDYAKIHDAYGEIIIKTIEERQKLGILINEEKTKEEVVFESLEGLQSLTEFHHSGGELFDGMPILLERNRRTPLKDGILKAWEIGEVKNDITGYGKYSASTITVEVDGENKSWPFSMVYHKKAK